METSYKPFPRTEPVLRPDRRFLFSRLSHLIALGFGSGLSRVAPGTVGTLWAWIAFLLIDRLGTPGDPGWALIIGATLLLGWWASVATVKRTGVADPGYIVIDEVVAFWLVLWLAAPVGFWGQFWAFWLFRYFDAAKPGPVRWADRRYKLRPGEAIGWRQGWGILFDDLVAALCTLLVLALGVRLWNF